MQKDERKATAAQLWQVGELIQTLKYDIEWYDFSKLTRGQMARLIDRLNDDLRRRDNGHKSED